MDVLMNVVCFNIYKFGWLYGDAGCAFSFVCRTHIAGPSSQELSGLERRRISQQVLQFAIPALSWNAVSHRVHHFVWASGRRRPIWLVRAGQHPPLQPRGAMRRTKSGAQTRGRRWRGPGLIFKRKKVSNPHFSTKQYFEAFHTADSVSVNRKWNKLDEWMKWWILIFLTNNLLKAWTGRSCNAIFSANMSLQKFPRSRPSRLIWSQIIH